MQMTADRTRTAPLQTDGACACCTAEATTPIEVTVLGAPLVIEVCDAHAFLRDAYVSEIPTYAAQAQADGHP
ncbi:MAG TPA: hypothetical protein VF615_25730 [Longimicrobiaceae bacterium]|jgi:hypothetical protein